VSSATTTGLIGEYLTAATILSLGWRVSPAQQDSVDLVAWKDDVFMRVQVKSAHLRKQKDHRPCFQFQNGSGRIKKTLPTLKHYDILAHCGIDARRVHFQAVCCVNQYSQRRPMSWFDKPDIEEDSWQKAVEIIMETRNG
tara:strand:+ start:322 stop:741 length:420 start_codon:yes stop_codon:yes gene_type:complete